MSVVVLYYTQGDREAKHFRWRNRRDFFDLQTWFDGGNAKISDEFVRSGTFNLVLLSKCEILINNLIETKGLFMAARWFFLCVCVMVLSGCGSDIPSRYPTRGSQGSEMLNRELSTWRQIFNNGRAIADSAMRQRRW